MKKLSIMLTAVAVFICIVVMQAVPVFADTLGLGIVYGFDENGEIITAVSAGIAAYDEGALVEADDSVLNDAVAEYLLLMDNGSIYPLTYKGTVEGLDNVQFVLNDEDGSAEVLNPACAVLDEVVSVIYYNTDAEMEYCAIKITGISESNNYYLYDYEEVEGSLDNALSAMVVLNDDFCVVAYIDYNLKAYAYVADPALFQGTEPPPPVTTSNEDEDEPVGPAGPVESNVPGRSDPEPNLPLIIACVVGAVVLIGAIIFIVFASGKRKKPVNPSYDDGGETGPVHDINVINRAPVTPVKPQPPVREPVSEPVRVTPVLYGEGGEMDGRRYALGDAPSVVIGRAATCAICYSPDAPGISREHCIIKWNNGVLSLMDNGSSNGTYLRGTGKLAPQQPVALKNGDIFYLGEKKNAFKLTFE